MIDVKPLCSTLLAILSDGQHREPAVLATHTDESPDDVMRALDLLEDSGLPLVRSHGGRVGIRRAFKVLDALAIQGFLAELGRQVQVSVVPVIDSTNTALLRRARNFAPDLATGQLSILGTELQTAGRGRQGRAWSAQAGSSLAVSFARLLPRALAQLSGLSLVCGLAVRDALVRAGVEIELKWPNDLLWRGGKLGGILIEVHPYAQDASIAVIGVGLNIAPDRQRAEALAAADAQGLPAQDLTSAGAVAPVDRNRLVADLGDTLLARLDQFLDSGFAPFTDDWNAHHAYRDCPVQLLEHGHILYTGIARGVDEFGRLALETAEGPRLVVAGDVSLRQRRIS